MKNIKDMTNRELEMLVASLENSINMVQSVNQRVEISMQLIDVKTEIENRKNAENKENKNVRLEKTKISCLLHDYKVEKMAKGTPEYKYITEIVNKIDRTKAKEKESIVEIYHNILETYVANGKGTNDIALAGKAGFGDIIKLINSKVENNYCNYNIQEWDRQGIM